MRLQFGGGSAATTASKDITAHMGPGFLAPAGWYRPSGDRNEVVNFVLKPPRREESNSSTQSLDRALAAWPLMAKADWNAATQRLNVPSRRTQTDVRRSRREKNRVSA